MTVRELIEELEQYDKNLPVVNDYKEVADVKLTDKMYFLNEREDGYSFYPVVELE